MPRLENNLYSTLAPSVALPSSFPPPAQERPESARGFKSGQRDRCGFSTLTRAQAVCRTVGSAVCHLVRRILECGEWPSSCKELWIHPLFKKLAMHQADNYRGIHITSQLSKAAERLLASLFMPKLIREVSFGPFQFAYTKERGARDAILVLVFSFLLVFSEQKRAALCSADVSGAFDKVSSARLRDKMVQPACMFQLLVCCLLGLSPVRRKWS